MVAQAYQRKVALAYYGDDDNEGATDDDGTAHGKTDVIDADDGGGDADDTRCADANAVEDADLGQGNNGEQARRRRRR